MLINISIYFYRSPGTDIRATPCPLAHIRSKHHASRRHSPKSTGPRKSRAHLSHRISRFLCLRNLIAHVPNQSMLPQLLPSVKILFHAFPSHSSTAPCNSICIAAIRHANLLITPRRDGREAEGGGLLNRYRVKSSIEGSNPSLSASIPS